MIHQTRDAEAVFAAVARKSLLPMDGFVFWGLVHHMDRFGKVRITTNALAELLGFNPQATSRSITRLRRQMMVAKVYDRKTGEHYFLLNPYVASVGGPQRRGHLWAQFQAAAQD